MIERIGITGASGYIGQALVRRAQRAGSEVVAIGRRDIPGLECRYADLERIPPPSLLDGLDAVVHLAADTGGGDGLASAELRFVEALARTAADADIPLLVISSQTASPSAPSAYGRTKAAIECVTLPLGAVVVRPGMVYGGPARGFFGTLLDLTRKLPLLPDLRPPPLLQPVHVDDLADALLSAVGRHYQPGRVWRVAGSAMPFGDFLGAIARYRLRRKRLRVPVPAGLLGKLLRLASPVLGPALSSERLASLLQLPPMEAEEDLLELDVRLRAMADGLSPSGRPERRLLEEGRMLMHAFLGRPPQRWLSRRYARAMRCHGLDQALAWPGALLAHPAWVAALDTPAFRREAPLGSVAWRYAAAIRIAEAGTAHAELFLGSPAPARGLVSVLDIGLSCVRELHARCMRPQARRLLLRLQ